MNVISRIRMAKEGVGCSGAQPEHVGVCTVGRAGGGDGGRRAERAPGPLAAREADGPPGNPGVWP